MFCDSCGGEIQYNQKYCPYCGAEVMQFEIYNENVEKNVNNVKISNKKKKNKVLAVMFFIISCLSLVALFFVFNYFKPMQKFNRALAKDDIET
ncbi:MAG: hypothetical protein ACI4D8_07745, partial [Wujia sp.]